MAEPSLGKAYVQIVPSADGISHALEEVLGGPLKETGKKLGEPVEARIIHDEPSELVGGRLYLSLRGQEIHGQDQPYPPVHGLRSDVRSSLDNAAHILYEYAPQLGYHAVFARYVFYRVVGDLARGTSDPVCDFLQVRRVYVDIVDQPSHAFDQLRDEKRGQRRDKGENYDQGDHDGQSPAKARTLYSFKDLALEESGRSVDYISEAGAAE